MYTEQPTTSAEPKSCPRRATKEEWVETVSEISYMRGAWDIVSIFDNQKYPKEEEIVYDAPPGLEIQIVRPYKHH